MIEHKIHQNFQGVKEVKKHHCNVATRPHITRTHWAILIITRWLNSYIKPYLRSILNVVGKVATLTPLDLLYKYVYYNFLPCLDKFSWGLENFADQRPRWTILLNIQLAASSIKIIFSPFLIYNVLPPV